MMSNKYKFWDRVGMVMVALILLIAGFGTWGAIEFFQWLQ